METGIYEHSFKGDVTETVIYSVGEKLANIEERCWNVKSPEKIFCHWFHKRFPINRIVFGDDVKKIRELTENEIRMTTVVH